MIDTETKEGEKLYLMFIVLLSPSKDKLSNGLFSKVIKKFKTKINLRT